MLLLPLLNDSSIKLLQSKDIYLQTLIDKNYCLIHVKNNIIQLSLFIISNNDVKHICQINFRAISCNKLFFLIGCHRKIYDYISFNHALYIGKEIYKAELSKTFKQIYIQL